MNNDTLNVLIIEDNPDYVELARYMLKAASEKEVELISAGTLNEGIEVLSASKPDMVLLDLGLPDCKDIDSVHALKKINAHIPVVVLSAEEDEGIAMSAIKAGADDFLVKGRISDWQLCRTVNYAIERRNLYRELERLAHFDHLTKLPNRNMFIFRLKNELDRAKRYESKIAMLYIDLDKFKPVNDEFGHSAGDKLLFEVAKKISSIMRKSDTVARLSGDEFGIIIEEVESDRTAETVTKKIIDIIAEPFQINGASITISASIGIAISDGDDSVDGLIEKADTAMYKAKHNGKNKYAFHEPK